MTTHAVTREQTICLTANVTIQGLDHVIGTLPSVRSQLNIHKASVGSLLDSVVISDKVLDVSSGRCYDNDAEAITMPKDNTVIHAQGSY